MPPFYNPQSAIPGGGALPNNQGISDFLAATSANQAAQGFGSAPGPSPDQSFAFAPPPGITAPTIDFSKYANDPTGAATAISSANNSLIKQEQDQRNGVFGQYQTDIAAFNPGGAAYQRSNIPLYQQQMNSLQYLLDHLSGDVDQRLQGATRVTAGTRDKLFADEQAPLSTNLNEVGKLEGQAQTNLNLSEQNTLKPLEAYLSSMDSGFNNINSVFNSSADKGLAGIQQLQDIKQKDADRAAQLAAARIAAGAANNPFGYVPPGGANSGPAGTNGAAQLPPGQQAVNDVKTRIAQGATAAQLISDYNATKLSADRGNPKDIAKLAYYAYVRPDLFGSNSMSLGPATYAAVGGGGGAPVNMSLSGSF